MVRRNGYWVRHPNKEIQAFLIALDEAGWRIVKLSTYYAALCPCGGHKFGIHLTPSDPYYLNKRWQYLRNQTCFGLKGDQK